MHIKINFLILCLLLGHVVNGQPIGAIKIGEKVPEISFKNVLNYKDQTIALKDYSGKLIILDFWDTTCSNCIEAFPKMTALQEQFKDRLQIFLVNSHPTKWETVDRIKATLEKYKKRTGYKLDLPVPVFDTVLNTYFPHDRLPHLVLIDARGKLIGATHAKYLTTQMIEKILADKEVDLPIKNDFLSFDPDISVLGDKNGNSAKNYVYRSAFTRYNNQLLIRRGIRRNEEKMQTGLYIFNQSIWNFIIEAYDNFIGNYSSSKIILDVKDSLMYQKNTRDTTYLYCYDLVTPPQDKLFKFKGYLADDLKKSFNIHITKEKRIMKTLVLTAGKEIRTSAYQQDNVDIDTTSIRNFLYGISIEGLTLLLDEQLKMPCIDETGLSTKRVDIDLPAGGRIYDKAVIVKALKKAGFEIKEEEREMEVVVITDK